MSFRQGALEVRNSVTHQATVFANAVMHTGTTVDTFITENLDWMKRATNVMNPHSLAVQ